MKKKKGFTLIELLAVIIILGILMLIAIPSVTSYINNARKQTYVDTIKELLTGASQKINSGDLDLLSADTTYYIPTSCIPLESGSSPYGQFDPAYVVTTFDGDNYTYYFTGRDTAGMGIKQPMLGESIDSSNISSDLKQTDIKTTTGIGNRTNIKTVSSLDCSTLESGTLENTIGEEGYTPLDPDSLAAKLRDTPSESSATLDYATTSGNGKYILEETIGDPDPIYFYRGNVDNNNVIFAGYCWKIVITTNKGGIKLVYNGTPSNNTCNNTGANSRVTTAQYSSSYGDNTYMGYKYGIANATNYEDAHSNRTDSTIKVVIENWFRSHMTSYIDYLEDSEFCNDRSLAPDSIGKGYGTIDTHYSGRERLNVNREPSIECTNANDVYTVANGRLSYPVALLTADEIALAGAVWNTQSTHYLNIGVPWWTMTPSRKNNSYPSVFVVLENGGLWAHSLDYDGVRPSVVLKKGTKYKKGTDGTPNNPYIVE